MTKELIERLRDTASKGVSVWGDLQMEAAKEIEILTAEREAYASAMDRMKAELAAIKAREPVAWRWRMNGQWHYGPEPLFKDGFTTQEPLYDKPILPVREPDWLLKTTQDLARAIARDNLPDVPQWEVFDDLPGVISQIDNIVCGMERKKPVREPLSDAQINEIRLVHGVTSSGRGIREVAQVISFARAIEAAIKEQA